VSDQIGPVASPALATLAKPGRSVGAISAYLQRAIETGAYSEGDKLPPERQLAETFKAARSTVRRALDRLEKEGLVSRRLGSGTFVGAPIAAGKRPADLVDELSPLQLIEARLAVEPFTARLAVLHATRRTLDEMESVLAQSEASVGDKDSFSKWDGEFHLLIARASANPLLLHMYRQINHVRLHRQWDAMKEKVLTPDVIADYNRQHRSIFNALHVRDAQLAQTLITEHLQKAREDLVKANSP
jgi:DNA-binding FadR family transcriptional regulator